MIKLFIYLLESSAVLALFYVLYILILRRETFFSINRFFLIGILVFSLLFPSLSFDFIPSKLVPLERPVEEISKFRMSYYDEMAAWEFDNFSASESAEEIDVSTNSLGYGIDWFKITLTVLFVLYVVGMFVCLSRTVWTMQGIWKMTRIYPREKIDGVKVVKVPNPIAPFSFLNCVFVHDALVNTPDFDQIMDHEKTHIRQNHSVDLIFVQLLAAFLWFNPLIWQLIKSLKTAHEYIADNKVINAGYSLVEYQSLLLRQLISNNSFGLVHNFNLSFIKKRITMMKIKKSGWAGKAKVAFTLSVAVVFGMLIIQCNSTIEEGASLEVEKAQLSAELEAKQEFINLMRLPELPETGYKFKGNMEDVLSFTISDDNLTIDGESYEMHEIASTIEKSGLTEKGVILMRIDQDQTMSFVRDVWWELRKAGNRKFIYIGRTSTGEKVEMPFLLPPAPGHLAHDGKYPESIDLSAGIRKGDIVTLGDKEILTINLGNRDGIMNQGNVDSFVRKHMRKHSSNYVVSATYQDDDTYNDYLLNLVHIHNAFTKIYQERAQEMFGKNFYDLDRKNKTEKEQYHAVRKGIPRAISVAERKRN